MTTKPSVDDIAKQFGCSPDNVRSQFRKNAAHIRGVIAKLKAGKPSSNYTASDIPMLTGAAENYERKALPSLESQLEQCLPDWRALVKSLIPKIGDDYRATDDPDDDIPGMCLTIGFTPETREEDGSWHYQTGDNSFSGGAYGHPHWAVVYLYRDSDPAEVADDIASQIGELACS